MKIIVGLGNPGKKYAATPHNVGFLVVEELARRLDCRLKRSFRFKSRQAKAHMGDGLLLVQPQTYMNNSGAAVAAALKYWKVEPEDLIVVLDDADLELGKLRIRLKGGSGGHRGLESIIDRTGTSGFVRLRVGIGRDQRHGNLVKHVLTPFGEDERERVNRVIARSADAVMGTVDSGGEAAMNEFNGVNILEIDNTEDTVEKEC